MTQNQTNAGSITAAVHIAPQFAPGFVLPQYSRHVTQSMIDEYARATRDFNPIHTDPDYARTGPFGRTIAHGLMTLTFAAQMLNAWSDGAFDASGEIEVAFVGPVFADETIELEVCVNEVVLHRGRRCARCSLDCRSGGRKVLVGTVYQPVDQEKVS